MNFEQDLARIAHQDNPLSPPTSTTYQDKKNLELVDKTCRYLQAHLSAKFSLNALSKKMATNRNTLSQAFKNILGQGVFSWLRTQRMIEAKKLLENSDLSIQEICYEVGYNDPANFSTSYRKTFKISPYKHRKIMQQSQVFMMQTKV